jgi:multidrug resistance efflux pump
MSTSLRRIIPSQRRHYRVTVPIIIGIEGAEYETLDWSISGFRLGGVEGRIKPDDIRNIQVRIPFQAFDVGFFAKARILRYDRITGELAGEFMELDARKQETLATFIQGMMRGEMAAIDGVIRRLDLPVTPTSLVPSDLLPEKETEERRRWGMHIYAIAGGVLAVMTLTLIYANFFQMRIDSAFIMGRNDVIVSPAAGYIAYIAEPNKKVAPGEPLVTMVDQKLEDAVHAANFKARDAEVELSRINTMYELEQKRLTEATDIVEKEMSAASNVVKSLKKNLQVKRVAMQRLEKLAKQGYVANAMLDKAHTEYLDTEQQLSAALGEEAKRQRQYATIKAGFQIRDETVETGTHDIEEMRRTAAARLENAKMELEALTQRHSNLAIKAPTEGKLVRVFTPQFGSAQYGEPIAVFERDGTRVVQAFLTQEEALDVMPGQRASVYFPNHWWSVEHRVIDVDFYSLTINQTRGHLQWQNSQNDGFKTVVVTLEPVGNRAMQSMQQVPPGTAAKVVFTYL